MESTTLKLPLRAYDPGSQPKLEAGVRQYSRLSYVQKVESILGAEKFKPLESSFLRPVIELSRRTGITVSGKMLHFLLQRRLFTRGDSLWFSFAAQPIRFSEREFFLTTGILFSLNSLFVFCINLLDACYAC